MEEPNVQRTFCRICESLCGLEVTTKNNKVIDIKPDANHISSKVFTSIKGLRLHEMYNSPDRLLHPRKKIAGLVSSLSGLLCNQKVVN